MAPESASSVNHQDTRDYAIALLDETGVRYPSGYDPEGTVALDYGLFGMPTTIFISAEGELLELERDGPWAVIRVVDTGPGSPADGARSSTAFIGRVRSGRAGRVSAWPSCADWSLPTVVTWRSPANPGAARRSP
jgi:hypothetical protein